MNLCRIIPAAMLVTLVSSAALAAGNTAASQPAFSPLRSQSAAVQMAKPASSAKHRCTALEARFVEELAGWKGGDQWRLADAMALGQEGAAFCSQGHHRAADRYLKSAIDIVIGKPVS